jgi:hypothetical protein
MDPLFKPNVLRASHLKRHKSSITPLFCQHVFESTASLSTIYTPNRPILIRNTFLFKQHDPTTASPKRWNLGPSS